MGANNVLTESVDRQFFFLKPCFESGAGLGRRGWRLGWAGLVWGLGGWAGLGLWAGLGWVVGLVWCLGWASCELVGLGLGWG